MSAKENYDYQYPGEHKYKGKIFHKYFPEESLRRIEDELEMTKEDLVIASYPKTGTTWTMELVYHLQNGYEAAGRRETCMDDLFYHLELQFPNMAPSLDYMLQEQHPWNAKTHLDATFFKRQLENLESCPRFLCIFRNVKDTLVSFYNFHMLLTHLQYEGNFDDFFSMFKAKKLIYGDPIDYMLSWWQYRDHPKVHIVRYEDMLEDSVQDIQCMGTFLGVDIFDEEAQKIKEGCSFKRMRERGFAKYQHTAKIVSEETYKFFRKGEKGDWRNHLSKEQSKYIDELVKEQCHPVGLYFKD